MDFPKVPTGFPQVVISTFYKASQSSHESSVLFQGFHGPFGGFTDRMGFPKFPGNLHKLPELSPRFWWATTTSSRFRKVFPRFPTDFPRFPKDFPKFPRTSCSSKELPKVIRDFLTVPKDFPKFPRCFRGFPTLHKNFPQFPKLFPRFPRGFPKFSRLCHESVRTTTEVSWHLSVVSRDFER